jgi:hypothetical protein
MPRSPFELTVGRRLLLAGVFCAAALWAAGPAGRLPAAMALLVLAPGYLVERALPGPRAHPLARFALWVGLGLSLTPLLYQWLWAAGLALPGVALAALAAAVALAALIVTPRAAVCNRQSTSCNGIGPRRSGPCWP